MKWLIIIFFVCFISEAQITRKSSPRVQKENLVQPEASRIIEVPEAKEIFKRIEIGLQTNSIEKLINDFGATVSITIGTSERSFFSHNQAFAVLSDYFFNLRTVSFKFSKISNNTPTPFATGSFVYIYKGNHKSAQIYVSLSFQEDKWVITQFNIY